MVGPTLATAPGPSPGRTLEIDVEITRRASDFRASGSFRGTGSPSGPSASSGIARLAYDYEPHPHRSEAMIKGGHGHLVG